MNRLLKFFLPLTLLLASSFAWGQVGGNVNALFPNSKFASPYSFTATGSACLNLNGLSAFSLTVSGTWTNFTVQVQDSNNSNSTCATGNFTTVQVTPEAGGAALSTISANGTFRYNFAAMMQSKLVVTCSSCTGTIKLDATASAAVGADIPIGPISADPCQDKTVQKTSVAITGTAPNTVKAIPLAAGKQTTVCELIIVTGASATSVTISAGTGTTCGTGNVALTGAMPITAGQQLFVGWGGAVWGAPQIPVANDVCVAVAGGTAGYGGSAVIVQQ